MAPDNVDIDSPGVDPELVFLMGQGMASGGFFGGTRGLPQEFGAERIRNTSITEAFMVGCAAGAAMAGAVPIVHMGFAGLLVDRRRRAIPQAHRERRGIR